MSATYMAADKTRLKTLAIVLRSLFTVIGDRSWIGRDQTYIEIRRDATLRTMFSWGMKRSRQIVSCRFMILNWSVLLIVALALTGSILINGQ